MPSLLRRAFAEALGTFALVFFGTGAVASAEFPGADYGVLGVALAHGLVLAVLVTALMGISGGHLNPAVSLRIFAARRTSGTNTIAHIVAQLLGPILAAGLLRTVYPT